jgi:hypothetical protein
MGEVDTTAGDGADRGESGSVPAKPDPPSFSTPGSVIHNGPGDVNIAGRDVNVTHVAYGCDDGPAFFANSTPGADRARFLAVPFLYESFQKVQALQPPSRLTCRELRVERGSSITHAAATVNFQMEIQASDLGGPRFTVDRGHFHSWLGRVETEPVVVLAICAPQGTRPGYWMLCFHDWLVRAAGLVTGPWDRREYEFGAADFVRVGSDGLAFHERMRSEAERAAGVDGATWRTLRDYGLIPVDEATLLEFMEYVRFLEIPVAVFQRLARSSRMQLTRALRQYLVSGGSDDQNPAVQEWLSSVGQLALPSLASGFERKQFRRFVRLMTGPEDGMRLPRYRGPEVGCWRSFVAMYPESVDRLARVVATSTSGNAVAFVAAMLPMLALSADPRIERKAWQALRTLEQRTQDFSRYEVRRELLRAPAEAGDRAQLGRSIRLITAEGADGLEMRFLSRYGWTPDVVEANINRKLNRPAVRDANLADFYVAMADVVVARRPPVGRS